MKYVYVSGRIVRGKYIWLGLEWGSGRANRKWCARAVQLGITVVCWRVVSSL